MLRNLDIQDRNHLEQELQTIAVASGGIDIMLPKGEFHLFKTDKISSPAAILLKEQMLKLDAECAVSEEAVHNSTNKYASILMGTREQYKKLVTNLDTDNFPELAKIVKELKHFFATRDSRCLKIRNHSINLDHQTLVMGILNVTPDSFSDGGQYANREQALEQALDMEHQGAQIIDIGGESTRPGAQPVAVDAELKRVIPIIEDLRQASDVYISIDTYKAEVAEQALAAGADLVNDISGLHFDKKMAPVIAQNNATLIAMHIQGTPQNMQKNPNYDNLVDDILKYFEESIKLAHQAGIDDQRIIFDPGFGFGKTLTDNYYILKHLQEFKSPGYPLLIGTSRKSFIGEVLEAPVDQRLVGTLATLTAGIMNGADILRVHDAAEAVQAAKITDKIIGKR